MRREEHQYRIERLEHEVARLRGQPPPRSTSSPVLPGTRLAITRAMEGEDYPSEGSGANTFGIVFQDSSYSKAPGARSPASQDRSQYPRVVARNLVGDWVPEGTEVAAWNQSKDGVVYWYFVAVGSVVNLVLFDLDSAKDYGTLRTNAKIRSWNGSAYEDGDDIEVYDSFGIFGPSKVDAVGAAIPSPRTPVQYPAYEIVWLQQIVKEVKATAATGGPHSGSTVSVQSVDQEITSWPNTQSPNTISVAQNPFGLVVSSGGDMWLERDHAESWRIVEADTDTLLPTVPRPIFCVAKMGSSQTFDAGTDEVSPSNGKLVELTEFQESGDSGWALDAVNFYLECESAGDYWVTIGGAMSISEKAARTGEWFAEFCGYHWSRWVDSTSSWTTGFSNSVNSFFHFGGTNTSVRVDVTHTMASFSFRQTFAVDDRIRLICHSEQIRDMADDSSKDGEVFLGANVGGWVKVEKIIE